MKFKLIPILAVVTIAATLSALTASIAGNGSVIDSWKISGWSGRKAYKVQCDSGKKFTVMPCHDGKWGQSCTFGGTYSSFSEAVGYIC